ncbi:MULTISPECIES: hypothetical protein [Cellulophaga]|jgi:predicted RNase H-like nuclease (RuvC/YqgF family)|uniref:Uncharacterized protein n=1 Tax=Cellulophaga baltica TaxID=76594 RepID=A0A1G7F4G3_9FLAO|nr:MULTISPECIES: hypothetical protein [Cellulophaga]KGK31081.1 hypothetical protein EL45_05250 [Cellulophaga sp. E6(2014)]MBA6314114.1 hypothetical protein [Cellulophaga baltica]MCR1025532.1 hypothetical protein [Cellulophaga baltica]SDE70850.1 hypothetical protein SAMN04487992_10321 [Cellulophaga baltica]
MNYQDTKFNYKILLAALIAVVIGILIAFYYSYAQSQNKIDYLEDEKAILVKDLTMMKAEVSRLSTSNEVNEIEMQHAQYRIDQLLDSVGVLNFDIAKLREYRKELRKMELMHDTLRLRNNSLRYNNSILSQKYNETKTKMEILENKTGKLEEAEATLLKQNKIISEKLKIKSYLRLQGPEGTGYRIRGGDPIQTNKASTISRLRGCVAVAANVDVIREEKIIYLQFLDPQKKVIAHNAFTINVNGNTYSKKVEFIFDGTREDICDAISVPEGSLEQGTYTLNVFENEKLLTSTEFQLK